MLDGGHNPQCAEALATALQRLLPGRKVVFLIGVLEDKDYTQIMDLVMPCAERFFCLTPDSDRAMPAEKLAEFLHGKGAEAQACADAADGIRAAVAAAGTDGVVVAFGSLYQAGAVRTEYQKIYGI